MPSLALSGDLSDFSDDEIEVEIGKDEKQNCGQQEPESSSLSSSASIVLPRSQNLDNVLIIERLCWWRRWIQIPSLAVVALAVLPFVQGCLYTIGYRYGRRLITHYLTNNKQ